MAHCVLKVLPIVAAAICSCRSSSQRSDAKFYGTDSRRVEMSFSTSVLYDPPDGFASEPATILQSEHRAEVDELIDAQLAHMFGVFSQHRRPFDFVENPGIPRAQPEVEITGIEVSTADGKFLIHYNYRDIAVFKKAMLHGSQRRQVEFRLPRDPKGIFQLGLVEFSQALQIYRGRTFELAKLNNLRNSGFEKVNLCTSLYYNSEDDYWYFWNPDQLGCPEQTASSLQKVTAQLRPLNSTRGTYPEYDRLLGDNGNGDLVRVTYLVGIDHSFDEGDLGRQGFQKAFDILTRGREVLESHYDDLTWGEVDLFERVEPSEDVVFEVLIDRPRHKNLRLVRDQYRVLLNMYLLDPNSEDFVDLAVTGLRESDLFIYDGHSGLGGYFSVGRLFYRRHYTLPVNKYQVFYFNGCSTFSYYNADYFALKATPQDPRGTKNLDILTTGTGALFSIGPGGDTWLIRKLFSQQRTSWQEIIDTIYFVEPEDSALTHINGDKDNPRTDRIGLNLR